MYQALYRKWRPKTFSDVVGQEHITTTLKRQVAEGRLSHAYLFTGTRGTGKTSCAKILAKAVNCENPQDGDPCNACPSCLGIESGAFLDVMELDAASNNGVDNVRALRDEAVYSPAQVKKRVYIVDEVHMLSTPAFNALLKILEEPPEHLLFVLATTELHKVPATILSRCQRFSFRRILPRDIAARLDYVAKAEGFDLKPDGAELLARLSDGALRDALGLLDQCAASGGAIDADEVLETLGLAGGVQTAQLMEFILRRDAKAALLLLNKLYAGGKDVGAVLGELSTLARDLLIASTAPEGGAALLGGGCDEKTRKALQKLANNARLIQICTVLQETAASLQFSANRRTDAELCLLRLCDEGLSGDLTALNARIARLEDQLAATARYAASPAARTPDTASPAAPVSAKAQVPIPAPEPEAPPLPEDDAPPWDDADAPPPYGDAPPPTEPARHDSPRRGPAKPAPEGAEPPAEAPKAPAPESTASPTDGAPDDGGVFAGLLESYKNRLAPDKRAFLGMVSGRVKDDVLTVYCPMEIQKSQLDQKSVTNVLEDVTSASLGRRIAVRFEVGEPAGAKRDRMQDLLRMGSTFGNFTVK